jgi:hypothetical protein
MVLLNLLGDGFVEGLVDIMLLAVWAIPLFFVVKNLFAYLTAPGPQEKNRAMGALSNSLMLFVIFVLLTVGFNLFIRDLLF